MTRAKIWYMQTNFKLHILIRSLLLLGFVIQKVVTHKTILWTLALYVVIIAIVFDVFRLFIDSEE